MASNHSHQQNTRRIVPGPAGYICQWNKLEMQNAQQEEQKKEANKPRDASSMVSLSGSIHCDKVPIYDPDLWKGAWLTGCTHNGIDIRVEDDKLFMITNRDSFLFQSNIAVIKQSLGKTMWRIPEIMVLLKTLKVDEDALGDVADPFGSIYAKITGKTLKLHPKIRVGSVLILRKVVCYQEAPRRFYLNVTQNNVECVYEANTAIPYQLRSALKAFRKRLGLKQLSSQKMYDLNMKIKRRQSENTKSKTTQNKEQQNEVGFVKKEWKPRISTKRRYSDLMDIANNPFLITNDDDDDENEGHYRSPKKKKRKFNAHKQQNEDSKTEQTEVNNEKNDKEAVNKAASKEQNESDMQQQQQRTSIAKQIIAEIENKEIENDSDDDQVIQELDMNQQETPKVPSKTQAQRQQIEPNEDKRTEADNANTENTENEPNEQKNSGDEYIPRFSFNRKKKKQKKQNPESEPVEPAKQDEQTKQKEKSSNSTEHKASSTSTSSKQSRWSKHYEEEESNKAMNMFGNLSQRDETIPKGFEPIPNELFSQLEDGYYYDEK